VLRQQTTAALQFEHIAKVVALLHAPNRSQTDPLPGGAIAVVADPWIVFQSPKT
jgi:tRNA(Ile)-lysidine synthase